MADSYIDNIETNNMNFKHLETTKDIIISPKNEYGDPQRPDATHTWTAKVSDGTNFVGDYAVKINGASLIVDSEDFTKLPIGSYELEVWEQWTDPDGKDQLSIYPSPKQTIPFTIYANIADQAEKEIKRIGFQDVVDQAVMNIGMNYVFKVNTIEPDQTATVVQAASDGKNYVTFNIPRGAKGDKGVQGNPGNDGHTPVKGTDYWTAEDKQEIQNEDKQYIDSNIKSLNYQPKVVKNQAELETDYPQGTSGIIVTADTGHKWVWLGNEWNDCGIYQSAGIANDTVTPEMTTFISDHQNIYQDSQAKTGIYNVANNKVVYQDASVNSKFGQFTCFKFQPGTDRTFTVSGTDFLTIGGTSDDTLAWSDMKYDGVTGSYTFTVPQNVVWVYISYLTDNYSNYKIVPGTSLETGYELDKNIKLPSMSNIVNVGQGYQCKRLIDAINQVKPLASESRYYTIYIHDDSTDYTGTTYDLLDELGGTSYLATIENVQDNMQGFHLPPYVDLVGVGNVILKAELPDNVTFNQSANFSTIEIEQGNNALRNLTIKIKNGRYAVHDESRGKYPNATHNYDNVTFIHEGNASGLWNSQSAFGCGISGGCIYNFNNCIFDASEANGYPFGLHNYAPQLGSRINIDGAQVFINNNWKDALCFGFNGYSPVTTDKVKYAACYTDVFVKNVNNVGTILVHPETTQYSCTNNYRIHNFTDLKVNVEDDFLKQ